MGMVCLRWASMSACKEAQLGWGVGILSGAGLTGKGAKALATSLQNLDLNPPSNIKSKSSITIAHPQFPGLLPKKAKPLSLVSLCVGVLGRHLEDIIADLSEIAINLPADIKIAVAAIARRRKLLNDDVLIALADTSWEILDVSGSDVSDFGLIKAAEFDDYVEEDSWEELDTKEIASGAQSLRWLVWPNIDKNSLEDFSTECPRVVVNPKSSPFGFKGTEVPQEALQNILLDDEVVKDIDPRTWTMHGFALKPMSPSLSSTELSVAEKFRLAFVERDNRLAPKRAKNARQHQRRAVRELMLISTRAKAMVLASQVSKSLHGRSS
ncbi:hypothetical protein JHK85_005888 [Glycine max]|nr:hypothetical protein JHK85_005888 [Glycine max]